jgi:hypothetical protein
MTVFHYNHFRNGLPKSSSHNVHLTVRYARVLDLNRLFFHYRTNHNGSECVSKHILHITTVLNAYTEKLLVGRERIIEDLNYLSVSVRCLLLQTRLHPLCPQCENELKQLYFFVEKADLIAPPTIPN